MDENKNAADELIAKTEKNVEDISSLGNEEKIETSVKEEEAKEKIIEPEKKLEEELEKELPKAQEGWYGNHIVK